MKKFVKLGAVFAALVLVASCFMACKNDDDDDGYSLNDLQGMWFEKADEEGGMAEAYGFYVKDNKAYEAAAFTYEGVTKYYYYDGEGEDFSPMSISVSGTTVTLDGESSEFSINGDTLTIKEGNMSLKKASGTPTKVESDDALEKKLMEDFEITTSE